MKDIGEQTGFSLNTVSLALQDSPLVADGTAEIIRAAARRLNYQPNQLARSLVSRQSRTIGLILTNIRNPILTQAAQAIQEHLAEQGYALLFATSNHSIADEKRAIERFVSRQVDGILIYPTSHIDLSHVGETVGIGIPVVLLSAVEQAMVSTISFDARVGALKATEYLLGLGHRRIGLIDNSMALGNLEKYLGYEDALRAAGLPFDEGLVANPGLGGAGGGFAAMNMLMPQADPPTGILASNDVLAIGMLHWADVHGVRVPEDLSVVGFDNIEMSAHTRPPLTTINYAADDLARRAVRKLLAAVLNLDGAGELPTVELVEPELIIRESTAPRRA